LTEGSEFSVLESQQKRKSIRQKFLNIVSLYQAWGKSDQTVIWQKRLDALASLQINKTP